MKLYYSPNSPYVRKVLVAAYELGLAGRIELLDSAANPVSRDQTIVAHNPLGQVPTLLTDGGGVFADSRVICEYLDDLGNGSLFPAERKARWRALADQSLADGMLVATLLARYETFMRPEALRWPEWVAGQKEKIFSGLAHFNAVAGALAGRVDIGTITLACALSYLDLRAPDLDWRTRAPALAAWYAVFETRPSMKATVLGVAPPVPVTPR